MSKNKKPDGRRKNGGARIATRPDDGRLADPSVRKTVAVCVRVPPEVRDAFAAGASAAVTSQGGYFAACVEAKQRIDRADTPMENPPQVVERHSEIE